MAQPSTNPITMQSPGASSVPDNLNRLQQHSVPQHVPSSLDPGVFTVHSDFQNDALVALSKSALASGKTAAEKALALTTAVMQDESQTVAARHLLVRDKTFAASKPALEKLQATIDKLTEKIEKLDQHLAGPPQPTNAVPMMAVQEARRALREMQPADRRAAIINGIEVNDQITLQAISRAPAYTCGLTPLEQQGHVSAWAHRYEGEHVRHRAVLASVLEHTERGGKLLLQFVISLSSTKIAQDAERLRQRAQQAVAAAVPAE